MGVLVSSIYLCRVDVYLALIKGVVLMFSLLSGRRGEPGNKATKGWVGLSTFTRAHDVHDATLLFIWAHVYYNCA